MIEYEKFERLRVQDSDQQNRDQKNRKLDQLDLWNNDFMMFI